MKKDINDAMEEKIVLELIAEAATENAEPTLNLMVSTIMNSANNNNYKAIKNKIIPILNHDNFFTNHSYFWFIFVGVNIFLLNDVIIRNYKSAVIATKSRSIYFFIIAATI